MSDSPQPTAGPSNEGNVGRQQGALIRQFVEAYLQQHGFDKALETYRQGFEDAAYTGGDQNPEGEDESTGRTRAVALGDAVFRAPGPVGLDSAIKRNIPQASFASASTMSEHITPEFEAQAKYIIDAITKKAEGSAGEGRTAERGELLLDPSDRIEGYKRYRRWVDDGLDLWKPELDAVSFPLFAYTFLDLMQADFTRAARDFLARHKGHYQNQHPQELAALSSLGTRHHIEINPYCQRLLSHKYVITMSRNSHDILLQWLSGAGLDEEWEMGRQTAAGRAKAAVHRIVVNRIRMSVSSSLMPLDEVTLAAGTGLIPALNTVGPQAPPSNLKLGPAPMTDKLKEQVSKTLQDEEQAAAAANETSDGDRAGSTQPNGHEANGDVEMSSPKGEQSRMPTRERSPTIHEVKLEPDTEKHADLVSPLENETVPPVPGIFRIADLKREVEAVRDRRRMISLGQGDEERSTTPVLPSVLAFTVFDGSGQKTPSIEFSPDSSLMAVGSSESCIRLWSLKGETLKARMLDSDNQVTVDEGRSMRKLIGHSAPVYSMSYDPIYGSAQKPSTLLSASGDGTVRLWSLDTYTNLVAYRGHNRDPVWDVEWGPMGVYFASASRDRTAKLWSSDRVTPLRMYTGHLSDVNCVRFHPNSLYLATGSHDDTVRVWDVQRGACIRLFLGHADAVTTLAFSPDGRTLASAGLDSSIYLWDLGSSRPIKRMTGHQGHITSLSFSAESSVLVSSGLDSTVRCWDVKSAGGEKSSSMRDEAEASKRASGTVNNVEMGELPLGPGRDTWEEGTKQTSDLMSTFHTKRTPIIKVHHTPRNMVMVGGSYIPPSSTTTGADGHE